MVYGQSNWRKQLTLLDSARYTLALYARTVHDTSFGGLGWLSSNSRQYVSNTHLSMIVCVF